jgi:hypothetical protein
LDDGFDREALVNSESRRAMFFKLGVVSEVHADALAINSHGWRQHIYIHPFKQQRDHRFSGAPGVRSEAAGQRR